MTHHSYSHRCRCGKQSPSFDSREKARAWHARHVANECAVRRTSSTHVRGRPDEELLASARRLKPIPITSTPGNGRWRDSLNSDPWGAPPRGNQLLSKAWSGGQCLQGCIASLLGVDVAKVPDPETSYAGRDDWHGHYNKRLEQATGRRLDFLPAHMCPPRNPNALWIAGLREDVGDGHAVIARGAYVVHDPAGLYQGSLPLHKVVDGMLVVATQRVIPTFSPRGSGRMVVPA